MVEIPEVGRKISLGQPPDAVKRFQQVGYAEVDGVTTFVLVDSKIQGDSISWVLVEFPILYALYYIPVQVNGKSIPAFFAGKRPMLVGLENDVKRASVMIKYGNYGVDSIEEFDAMDIPEATRNALRKEIVALGGSDKILDSEAFVDFAVLDPMPKNEKEFSDIGDGIRIGRIGYNTYQVVYGNENLDVDVTLLPNEEFNSPVEYKHFSFPVVNFGIWHTGEYDGMDPYHGCAHTSIIHKYQPILIDYPANMTGIINNNGLSKNSINTVIVTHNHDDHIGAVVELVRRSDRCRLVTTEPVKHALIKKLSALVDLPENIVEDSFTWDILPFRKDNPYQTETLNLDGIQVTGHLSCHSVPTTVYTFKINVSGYDYTYGHFLDIVAFKRMKQMVKDGSMPEGHLIHLNHIVRETKYSLIKYDAGCVSDDHLPFTVHGQWQDLRGAATEPTFRVFSHAPRPLLDPAYEQEGRFVRIGDLDSSLRASNGRLLPLGAGDTAITAFHNQAYRAVMNYFESLVDVLPNSETAGLMRHYATAFANCPKQHDPNIGGFLIEQGAESRDVIVIVRGRAEIRKLDGKGEIIFRTTVGDGEVLGDVGVMAARPRMASVKSLNRLSYISVPSNLFLEAMAALGIVYEGYFKELFERLMLFESATDVSQDVSKIVINRIAKLSKTQNVERDEVLISAGHEDDRLIVVTGDVMLTVGHRNERIGGPALIGECELFLSDFGQMPERLHSAVALEPMEILILDFDSVRDVPVILDNIRRLIRSRCENIYLDLPQINPTTR